MSTPVPRTFTSLSSFALPVASRLPRNALCPTKDLLVLLSANDEGIEKATLYKAASGGRVWDVVLGKGERAVEVAWSPDGNFLMIARDPARLTLHSVHDSHELVSLTVPYTQTPDPGGKGKQPAREEVAGLRRMWWLEDDAVGEEGREEEPVPGSAECLLRSMPYLTPLREVRTESIFTLSKDKTTPSPSRLLPPTLLSFPSLLLDPTLASIQPPRLPTTPSARLKDDEAMHALSAHTGDSLLVVSDSRGTLHFFLQGTYPLGSFSLGPDCEPYAMHLLPPPRAPATLMLSFRRTTPSEPSYIGGCTLSLPLLRTRPLLQTARLSSLLRELLILIHHTTEDMSRTWLGSDGIEGAKDVGARWVRALARRGEGRTDATLDLIQLLCTGRPRPSMVEFLGGLTERTWENWNTTVHSALKSIERNCLERVVPACERLIVVLEELKGWSLWEDAYAEFEVPPTDISACISASLKLIELSQALATHILEERWSFDAMMVWLRWEVARLSLSSSSNPDSPDTIRAEHPGHDVLQVEEYVLSGLVRSPIDGWFSGPSPLGGHTPTTLARDGVEGRGLEAVMGAARAALGGKVEGGWRMRRPRVPAAQHSQLERNSEPVQERDYPPSKTAAERLALALPARNLPALTAELGSLCRDACVRAAGAVGRGAALVRHWEVVREEWLAGENVDGEGGEGEERGWFREIWTGEPGAGLVQYVALVVKPEPDDPVPETQLCILKLTYTAGTPTSPPRVQESAAVLLSLALGPVPGENEAEAEAEAGRWALLEWTFFDPVNLLLLLHSTSRTELCAVFYPDLPFVRLGGGGGGGGGGDTFGKVRVARRSGELTPLPLPIARSRTLSSFLSPSPLPPPSPLSPTPAQATPPLQLSTNPHPGRRTAAVLGGSQRADVCVFDLYGQEDGGE